jgi:hypothetical protein
MIGDRPTIKFVQDNVDNLIENARRAEGRMKEELQVILFFIVFNASPIPNGVFCSLLSSFPIVSFSSGTKAVYTQLAYCPSIGTLSEEVACEMTCALGRLFAMRSSEIQKLKLKDDIIFRMANLFITLLRRVSFEVVIQDLARN